MIEIKYLPQLKTRATIGIVCFIIELIVLFIAVRKINLVNHVDIDKKKRIIYLLLIILCFCCLTYNELWHDLSSNLS